jgi:hypothetical protein
MDSPREKWAIYFKNSRDSWQLIDENNHVYFRHSGETDPGKRSYWLCEDQRCKAMAIVQDDKLVHTPGHTHHSNEERLEARLCELRVIEKAGKNLTLKPSKVVNELNRLPVSVKQYLKSQESILRRIRKRRAAVRKSARAVGNQTPPEISEGSSTV